MTRGRELHSNVLGQPRVAVGRRWLHGCTCELCHTSVGTRWDVAVRDTHLIIEKNYDCRRLYFFRARGGIHHYSTGLSGSAHVPTPLRAVVRVACSPAQWPCRAFVPDQRPGPHHCAAPCPKPIEYLLPRACGDSSRLPPTHQRPRPNCSCAVIVMSL